MATETFNSRLQKLTVIAFGTATSILFSPFSSASYAIVDTGQNQCFDNRSKRSSCPSDYTGQDAQYFGNQPSYQNNQDGTINDLVTGLMWTASADTNHDGKVDINDKKTLSQALRYAEQATVGGHSDWRLPTIKELYSLILFDGQDPSGLKQSGTVDLIPFIDNRYFQINGGDVSQGERLIDGQFVSSTQYVSKTMKRDDTVFGVNFVDGRIKGYGISSRKGGDKEFYLLLVRGNRDYGVNQFTQGNDQTVTDNATGLIWQQTNSSQAMNFPDALEYCESLSQAGINNWRLPNVKELHSIVDYTRSPATSNSPALASIFNATAFTNEAGDKDWGSEWSSTTHQNLRNGANGAYISMGRSMGYMRDEWIDVHGAGAQRSDPKTGSTDQYPQGHGPQGDAVRVENYVRCVTGGEAEWVKSPKQEQRPTQEFESDANGSSQSMKGKSGADSRPQNGASNTQTSSNGLPDKIKRMDKNGDNKITKSEARGPLANDFDKLDRNSDGYLTVDELPVRR